MSLCSCVQHIEFPYLLRCGTTMQLNTSVIELSILSIPIRACICIWSLQPLRLCTEYVHQHRDNAMIAMQWMLQWLDLRQPPIQVINPARCNTRRLRSSTSILPEFLSGIDVDLQQSDWDMADTKHSQLWRILLLLLYFILCLQPLGYGILEYMTWVSKPYSALVSSVSHSTFYRGPPLSSSFLVHCQLSQSGSHSSLQLV